MSSEQVAALIAFVSAVVAAVATAAGVFERKRAFQAQQLELARQGERWQSEFAAERRSQEVLLRSQFLLEQYRRRLSSYSSVMRTLGVVSSVNYGTAPDAYEELHSDQELLRATSVALYDHLYSEAGLLMAIHTRAAVHTARSECLAFIRGDGSLESGDRLVDAFYYARRALRADLELLDDRSPENLDNLATRLMSEAPAAGVLHADTIR